MIYVGGDSWSVELPDVSPDNIWPQLVVNKLNQQLFNDGMGCSSNSRIYDCLESHLLQGNQPELVIISLTTDQRWHLPAPNNGHWSINSSSAVNDRTGAKDEFINKWYYANSYSEIDSIFRYYKIINNIHEICRRHEVKVICFQAWDQTTINLNIFNDIDGYVSKFYPLTDVYARFYIECFNALKERKYFWNYVDHTTFSKLLTPSQIDTTYHPTRDGHITIADFVYQQLTEYKLI